MVDNLEDMEVPLALYDEYGNPDAEVKLENIMILG